LLIVVLVVPGPDFKGSIGLITVDATKSAAANVDKAKKGAKKKKKEKREEL
jgi:hypothetical protein